MKTRIWILALASTFALSLGLAGCGAEDTGDASVTDELLDESLVDESGEDEELCLSHMDCYNPDEASADPDEMASVHGIPAPGSQCPVPEPYGFEKGDRLENVELVDCEGNPFKLHERICGSTVSWVYFYRGPS